MKALFLFSIFAFGNRTLKILILNNNYLTSVKQLIADKNNFVITTHNNPDGDAIGSSLALYNYLISKDKSVKVITPNNFPENLAWIKGADEILVYNMKTNRCNAIILSADIIFCLDFNALNRTGGIEDVLRTTKAKKVLIDHHPQPELDCFDFAFSKTDISSSAELTYNFITALDGADAIDIDIANGIYTGIVTDTGSFSYSCNYEDTFKICAALLKTGIDAETIHRKVYDTFSENSLRLLGYCLSEKLEIIDEFSTAYIWLTKEDLNRFNYQVGDTEGVVNYALAIDKIKFAALFTEREGIVRISFRSKGEIDVNEFARNHFEGGGHKNASGATSKVSLSETIEIFKNSLNNYRNILAINKNEETLLVE